MNKPKLYICNAFSLSMLDRDQQDADFPRIPGPVSQEQVLDMLSSWCEQQELYEFVSAVGHADTAALLSKLLDRTIPMNRISVKLEPEDFLLVAQYVGPRLPEGATELPPGATIEWWVV